MDKADQQNVLCVPVSQYTVNHLGVRRIGAAGDLGGSVKIEAVNGFTAVTGAQYAAAFRRTSADGVADLIIDLSGHLKFWMHVYLLSAQLACNLIKSSFALYVERGDICPERGHSQRILVGGNPLAPADIGIALSVILDPVGNAQTIRMPTVIDRADDIDPPSTAVLVLRKVEIHIQRTIAAAVS